MTIKQGISTTLVAAMMTALLPATGYADPAGASSSAPRPTLRAAIHQAAVQAANQQNPGVTLGRPASTKVRKQSSGGGGHTMMVIGLLTTAAGIAATYFVVKDMQKTTKSIVDQQQ